MNKKEIGEIKRRTRRDRSNMRAVYGCYVGEDKQVISEFKASIGTMYENEQEKYMALFKKVFGGTLGKNLIDISFPTGHVAGKSQAYQILADLRKDALENDRLRTAFYQNVIESLVLEGKYVILLAADSYDVPFKNMNDENDADAGNEVFRYILCAVCPVKETKPNLHYVHEESIFHDGGMIQAVGNPDLGFMFPAFNNRATDLYGAMYYCRKPANFHKEFVERVFGVSVGQSADEQQQSFHEVLFDSLKEECNMEAMVSLHEQAQLLLDMHKEAKNPDTLTVTASNLAAMLSMGGVSDDKLHAFSNAFEEAFGRGAEVPIENIVDPKKFNISTNKVSIKATPEAAGELQVRKIDGVEYILVPVDSFVDVNGISLHIGEKS